MKVLTAEELKAIKEAMQKSGKQGNRKACIKIIAEMVKTNKGKSFLITPDDVKPYFTEGFTIGFDEDVATALGIATMYGEVRKMEKVIKGEKSIVERWHELYITA